MPSLETASPPELGNNVIRHNTELVVDMVRQQLKKHMHETDPEKIQKLKDDERLINHILYESEKTEIHAARGLINHILYESEKTEIQ